MLKAITVFATAALLSVPSIGASKAEDPAHGYWLTENGRAIIEFSRCGSETCGRTVWVARPYDEAGQLKRDINNPDNTMRNRPICGLDLLGGLDRAKTGTWKGGWIYNPRDGETYSAKVQAISPDELEVRGYLGLELLGKSQIWTRVTDDRGGC